MEERMGWNRREKGKGMREVRCEEGSEEVLALAVLSSLERQ